MNTSTHCILIRGKLLLYPPLLPVVIVYDPEDLIDLKSRLTGRLEENGFVLLHKFRDSFRANLTRKIRLAAHNVKPTSRLVFVQLIDPVAKAIPGMVIRYVVA
eukprot:TRINITY_DN2767_c0_g1_i2.p1 TRINITY_DN2767_c0_g1~~TRINITY_DN2767_c0_g1_i2.p1  ORF type:complete len:103 (-),score=3.37 TRINITY_DN2767_c0_g1_i2:680-988(-)